MSDTGLLGELMVMGELVTRGFKVAWVSGDQSPYDLISDCNGHLCRLQVKATAAKPYHGAYRITCGKGYRSRKPYTNDDCDFIVVVILERRAFYVVPVDAIGSAWLTVMPGGKGQYEKYRGNWEALKSNE